MTLEFDFGWQLWVDEGPEWLFVRIEKTRHDASASPPLAEQAWRLAESKKIYRMVVEWPPDEILRSYVIGQFILLHKRCHLAGGTLRLCNLTPSNYGVLEVMRLAERFPNYANREAAVMGYRR